MKNVLALFDMFDLYAGVMKNGLIETVEQFDNQLSYGAYAFPGFYPLYFLMSDGEAMSFESAKKNADQIREAIATKSNDGWRVVAVDVNWERVLYCCDSGKQIESAYDSID
jgi:hypothetical protein